MSQDPTRFTKPRVNAPVPDAVDVAIVGAGMGGLTAGAYLSKAGFSVACFDSHYVAGGCVTQFMRGPKHKRYNFDVGLHYIGDCGPDGQIPTMLRGIGVEQEYVSLDPDGFDVIVLPELSFKIPVGIDRYRDRLVETFPKEKKGIDRYVRFLKEVDFAGRSMVRSNDKQTAGFLVGMLLKGRMVARYQNATIGEVLDSCTQNPTLRAIMLGQSGDYGLPPSQVSALLHAGLANHYFKGAVYPRGGGQIIADRIAEALEGTGGSIHLRHGISKILIEDGRAVGVRTAPFRGESKDVRAKVVLSGADLKHTLVDLVGKEHLPERWVTRVDSFEMGGAIFLTCLGVAADMSEKGMGNCNYWQFDTTDMESVYTQADAGVITPRCAYITCASLKDPTTQHAPEGISNVEVMTLVPGKASAWGVSVDDMRSGRYRQDGAYLAKKAAVEEDLVRRLDNLFPGTADQIVFRESASPVTHSRYTQATDGTGYGLAATPAQFLKGRPSNRGPLPELYLCGASTRAGHGVVGAMRSGYLAALKISDALGAPIKKR